MKYIKCMAVMSILGAAFMVSACGGTVDTTGSSDPFSDAAIPGEYVSLTVGTSTVEVVYANSSSTDIVFPMGTSDNSSGTVSEPFFIGGTEVTYAVWYEVYTWATSGTGGATGEGAYTFANAGTEGNDGTAGVSPTSGNSEPVTNINWRDAIVWCNAFTEYYNARNSTTIKPVYYTDTDYTTPLRTATDSTTITKTTAGSQDCPYIYSGSTGNTDMASCSAKGFRLPTSEEWEYSARYLGTTAPSTTDDLGTECVHDTSNYIGSTTLTPGYFWTPGDYASGAHDDYNDTAGSINTEDVAWYSGNSLSASHDAAGKTANVLGLYDMSGNVWEWCFDWYSSGSHRMVRGGGWNYSTSGMLVGYVDNNGPYYVYSSLGFRFARTQ